MNSYTYYELIVTATTIIGLLFGFSVGYIYTFLQDKYINNDNLYVNKDNIKYICAAMGTFIGYVSGIIFFLLNQIN
uniref:Uncharacterized protein n=1 Tax=Borely moumouvirus TaxID=2712067 RepID=A0A6G6AC84_9VIRU